MHNRNVLDLGCGLNKVPGAVGLDNVALPGVDIVHDLLDFPYPFEDASAQEIYLRHVLEHFELHDLRLILKEAYRLLALNGILHIAVPHAFSIAAWADPTHKMAFTFGSMEFMTINSPKAYYKDTDSIWRLARVKARVTWFNWKRCRLRKLDACLSGLVAAALN